eukprot:CAMPEP_0202892700 /NCGR_PEP_ID=MMETSP1392-20130828/2401_1 /ASSEMBLY_ACC=CAM_ASM_000868 /TAXON_ID=225041 /ORGANISM="Chlamydomonas chlamydogama, Strain SAG 11-48b" /LENGTH=221 /DNA_ID=CAMNT_0049576753 /DNA_START=141 /DNA_END=806 /DNA_ORIENTATION=-
MNALRFRSITCLTNSRKSVPPQSQHLWGQAQAAHLHQMQVECSVSPRCRHIAHASGNYGLHDASPATQPMYYGNVAQAAEAYGEYHEQDGMQQAGGLPAFEQVDWETYKSLPRCKVSLIGRTGSDVEYRTTGSGQALAKTRLAVNWRDDGGERGAPTDTDWYSLVFWGDVAQQAATIPKGTMIAVSGKVTCSRYVDRTGAERTKLEVNVYSLALVERNSGQ